MSTRFLDDRIKQTIKRLSQNVISGSFDVQQIQSAPDVVWRRDIENAKLSPFMPNEDTWGRKSENRLFTFEIVIPTEMDGKRVELHIQSKYDGTPSNPQYLAYVNGELIQGLDSKHPWVLLSDTARSGQQFRMELIGWSGGRPERYTLKATVCSINLRVRDLIYDIQAPLDAALAMEPHSTDRQLILESLCRALDLPDLRRPGSDAFDASVEKALKYMRDEFYATPSGNGAIVTALGHTHIDVAWLWTIYQTEQKTLRSFSTAARLIEQYPEYIFMSSQPQLYAFIKNRDPELYEKIKGMIQYGRWEAEGGRPIHRRFYPIRISSCKERTGQ